MTYQNDDPNSDEDENLVKQTQEGCQSDVLIINKIKDSEAEEERVKPGDIPGKIKVAGVSQRWVFAVMGCLGVASSYMMRVCLSLAITEMVTKAETSSNHTNSDNTCPAKSELIFSNSTGGGTYEWSEYTQGIILSSFFLGYPISHVPGAILAEKYGGKYTLGLGILSTAICTLVTPLVVQAYDYTGLIILRVIIGFSGGPTLPAVAVLISEWAPPLERTKIGSLVTSGISLGFVLGIALSGVLIRYSSIGWPIVFYVFGSVGVLWFLAWVLLCYNNPDVHPFISEREKEYLNEAIKSHTRRNVEPTPWRHIFTSVPMWALIAAKIGTSWGLQTMVSDLPKYMSSVLKFSIQINGFLSALPYVVMWLVGNASSWLADWSIKHDKVSRTNIRKLCNLFASIIPAIFIIAASYTGCDRTIVVILFTVGIGMTGMSFPSIMVNPNDLSPNYSGTLMAFGNSIAACADIAAPYAVGVLTPNQTLSEWRIVFWISAIFYSLTALIYLIWADGEVQSWNDPASKLHQKHEIQSNGEANKDPSPFKQLHQL